MLLSLRSLAVLFAAASTLAPAALATGRAPSSGKTEARLVVQGTGHDEHVTIEARAMLDRESMKEAVGGDPGPGYIVVAVTVTPAPGEKVNLDLDDFLLRSDKDGQHSRPLTPGQVAGNSVMVVKSVGGTQGRSMARRDEIPYGYPTGGPPSTLPGMGAPMAGGATADTSEAAASIDTHNANKANPLLDALKKHQLTDGEIDHPVSGLLYFQIDGKVKPKQLELVYRRAPPRISIRFTDPNKTK